MDDLGIKKGSIISRGGSSWVSHGTWKAKQVAIKEIDPDAETQTIKNSQKFLNEKNILTLLGSHYSIIQLFHAIDNPRCLILEVGEIELHRRLFPMYEKPNPVQFELRLDYVLQIAEGIAWMHGNRVLHMDLNLENVVLMSDQKVAKIIDFGWSVQLPKGENEYSGPTPTSIGYTAPEVFDQKYSFKSDAYSFGVMLWGLVVNLNPQKRSGPMLPPSDFPGCTETQGVFMQSFWRHEPKERPAMSKALLMEMKNQFNIKDNKIENVQSALEDSPTGVQIKKGCGVC